MACTPMTSVKNALANKNKKDTVMNKTVGPFSIEPLNSASHTMNHFTMVRMKMTNATQESRI